MFAEALAQLFVGFGTVGERLIRHRRADQEFDFLAFLVEHFLNQQHRAQRFVKRRCAVKQGRILGFDINWQHRRLRLARQFDEAALPGAVADALRRDARDFAGREENHGFFVFQRIDHRLVNVLEFLFFRQHVDR